MRFADRIDAARQLSNRLESVSEDSTVVLALPRGGVPLGLEIAKAHCLPFDVIVSKKIGHPLYPEFAIGALAEDGEPMVHDYQRRQVDHDWLKQEIDSIKQQINNRRESYGKVLNKQNVINRSVILVDDGIATGMTMKAAIKAVKQKGAASVTVAVPIIPEDTYYELLKQVNEVVAVDVPQKFLGAVGAYYENFSQVGDKEVIDMLTSYLTQS